MPRANRVAAAAIAVFALAVTTSVGPVQAQGRDSAGVVVVENDPLPADRGFR